LTRKKLADQEKKLGTSKIGIPHIVIKVATFSCIFALVQKQYQYISANGRYDEEIQIPPESSISDRSFCTYYSDLC
jgi:hypothetical protein